MYVVCVRPTDFAGVMIEQDGGKDETGAKVTDLISYEDVTDPKTKGALQALSRKHLDAVLHARPGDPGGCVSQATAALRGAGLDPEVVIQAVTK